MRNLNSPRPNLSNSRAKSNFNKPLLGSKMQSNALSYYRMKFSILAELMHTKTAILWILVWVLACGCSHKSAESPTPVAAEKKEESRISHGTNGETIIKLDAETQKLMGL